MAMSAVTTFTGSVASFGGVQFEDDIINMTITLSRDQTEVLTWNGSDAGLGSMKGEGTLETIYNATAGSPYMTIEDEMFSPTTGGIACVFRPEGTGSGLPEWTMNVKVTQLETGGAATDNKTGKFNFVANNINRGTQV